MDIYWLLLAMVVCGFAIWGIHKTSEKWKATWSLLLTITSILASYQLAAKQVRTEFEDVEVKVGLSEDFAKLVIEKHEVMLDSIRAEARRSLHSREAMRDSLLVEIAAVDTCVDKHFYRVNARLLDITKQLSER